MKKNTKKTFILDTEARKVTAKAAEWRNGWPTKLSITCNPSVKDEALTESEAEMIRQWIATDVDAVIVDYSKFRPLQMDIAESLARALYREP